MDSPTAAAPTQPQLAFAFLLPWSERKTLLTVQEVAILLDLSDDSVRALVDNAALEAHRFTCQGDKDSRQNYRITRRSVLAWLARNAAYETPDILKTLLEIYRSLPPGDQSAFRSKLH